MCYNHSNGINKFLFVLLLTIIVLICNGYPFGASDNQIDRPSISNLNAFAFELVIKRDGDISVWINEWFFQQPAPFKYRVLGKIPILITYQLFLHSGISPLKALYNAYVIWSAAFLFIYLFFSAELIHLLIIAFNPSYQKFKAHLFYISASLLVLLPPILFAFKFPVHGSPNDFLGYALIALSLLSLNNTNTNFFLVYSFLGIFCRETNLIVLGPFFYLPNITTKRKITVISILLGCFIMYRMGWKGSYQPLSGGVYNLQNPFETLLFLFISFAPFWYLGILGYRHAKNTPTTSPLVQALNRTFLSVTIGVIIIIGSFARLREIRIIYILYFYFIPYGLYYCLIQWRVWTSHHRLFPYIYAFLSTGCIMFIFTVMLTPKDYQTHLKFLRLFGHFYVDYGGGLDGYIPYLFSCYNFKSKHHAPW